MAQGRPAVSDKICYGRCLGSASPYHHVGAVSHAHLLDRRIDHPGAYLNVEMLFVQDKIVHSLKIYQQGSLYMRMGPGAIEACTVWDIWDIVSVTYLYYARDLFCFLRHDYAGRHPCHDTLIAQAAFISARAASVALADNRIIRNMGRSDY